MPWSAERVSATLSAILVEALRVDPGVVTPEARLFDDLGAESLDILDIRFRMEQAFGFHIHEKDLFRGAVETAGDRDLQSLLCVRHLIDYAVSRLAERVPAA